MTYVKYILYYIEKGLLDKKEISDCADNIIFKRKNVPYFVIELSLAESLDEQLFILYDNFPKEYKNYRNLSSKIVLNHIYTKYKIRELDTQRTINIIFHLKDDIDLKNTILQDIYLLDNEEEKFMENKCTSRELEKSLELFFSKYL